MKDVPDTTPLLPPDIIPGATCRFTVEDARSWYWYFKSQPQSKKRKRDFVYGALYQDLYIDRAQILDWFELGDFDIMVGLPDNTVSPVKVRSAASHPEYLEALETLGRRMGSGGRCRSDVGDDGAMWILGLYGLGRKERPTTVKTDQLMSELDGVQEPARQFFNDIFPEEFVEMQEANRRNKIPIVEGCEDWILPGIILSENLGNSSHYDYKDESVSVTTWTELVPGQAKNWFFVLPNVTVDGKRALVVHLGHGVSISWDGRKIRHCSAVPMPGQDNAVFGNFFSASN